MMRQQLTRLGRVALALAWTVGASGTFAQPQPQLQLQPQRIFHPLGTGQSAPQCVRGFVWREAYLGDAVCVDPPRRDAVRAENTMTSTRVQPGGGAYGPDTCRSGYVWRETRPADHVCVTPDSREIVARENARAAQYWSPCGTPENCGREAAAQRARVENLRQRLAHRQGDLAKVQDDRRKMMDQLRQEDENWARAHPGLGRSTQPSIADNVSPIEQDIRELEVALKDAERDAAKAEGKAKQRGER